MATVITYGGLAHMGPGCEAQHSTRVPGTLWEKDAEASGLLVLCPLWLQLFPSVPQQAVLKKKLDFMIASHTHIYI